MDIFISIIAIVLGIVAIVGSVLPALPGPPLAWVGLLLMKLLGPNQDGITTKYLMISLAIVVAVQILDLVVPAYFTKVTGGSRHGARGSLVGMLIGMVTGPGMIICSFIGAFVSELYWGGKSGLDALKSAFGSFVGFLLSTGIKIICSFTILWKIVENCVTL